MKREWLRTNNKNSKWSNWEWSIWKQKLFLNSDVSIFNNYKAPCEVDGVIISFHHSEILSSDVCSRKYEKY